MNIAISYISISFNICSAIFDSCFYSFVITIKKLIPIFYVIRYLTNLSSVCSFQCTIGISIKCISATCFAIIGFGIFVIKSSFRNAIRTYPTFFLSFNFLVGLYSFFNFVIYINPFSFSVFVFIDVFPMLNTIGIIRS